MKVAVIGAGPAGLTAAYRLAQEGIDVDVFEASDAVGGLARTISLWGQQVDLGPHRFFSNDPRVNRLWLEVVGRDYRMVDRLTRVYYRRRFFDYPLRASNALWNMGLWNAAQCLVSYFKEKVSPTYRPEDNETFESWVVGRFGRRLFRMFFQSYSEKLWGIPCHELDADFAAQRIKKFSLGEAVKNALGLGKDKHKTLVDQFAYPLGGSGMVYERMAEQIRQNGSRIHLRCPIRRVLHDNRRVNGLELTDGTTMSFDRVISTMPLTSMVQGLGDLPPNVQSAVAQLRFRNTLLVYLNLNGVDLFPDQWLYIHSPDLLVGRVTNFRNWTPELYGAERTTILALEYWANDEDALWREDDAHLIARAEREIRSTGLIGESGLLAGQVVRLRRCYPVYARGYKESLRPVIAHLNTFKGLTAIGRYGAFKYNNQDHSILMGILAAENILDGQHHDLWAINTDYDSYQESATITATGLVYSSGANSISLLPSHTIQGETLVPAVRMSQKEPQIVGECEKDLLEPYRTGTHPEAFAPSTGIIQTFPLPTSSSNKIESKTENVPSEAATVEPVNGPSDQGVRPFQETVLP